MRQAGWTALHHAAAGCGVAVRMGRKSYDRSLAWRIIYLLLGANAWTSPLTPIQVAEQMEVEHTPVGIKYIRACLLLVRRV